MRAAADNCLKPNLAGGPDGCRYPVVLVEATADETLTTLSLSIDTLCSILYLTLSRTAYEYRGLPCPSAMQP